MRKLPPLHSLRAFEAAARHLHFANAAYELGLTPTAISHQVRQLEETLGVKLFHRYPRPIRLTAAGESLYPELRLAFDKIAVNINQIANSRSFSSFSISVTVAFASFWLLNRIPRMRENTGYSINLEANDKIVDLRNPAIDLAIRYADRPTDDAQWIELYKDDIIAVCSPDLVNSETESLTEIEIGLLPKVEYRWENTSTTLPTWRQWYKLSHVQSLPNESIQFFSEELHAINAAVAGQGAVLASKFLINDLIRSGKLVQISPIEFRGLSYWAVYLETHPRIQELDLMINEFKRLLDEVVE